MSKKYLPFIFIVFIFGCVDFDPDNTGKDSVAPIEEECVGLKCNQTVKAAKAGIVRQSQLFKAFQSCLNLNKAEISAQTRELYSESRQILSAEGDLGSFSNPVGMAVMQTAGSFCQDLIVLEENKPERFFLKGFDLSTDNSGVRDPAQVPKDVERLAKSC